MTWGPFLPDLDPIERKARLRSLRALVKVLTGPRGEAAAYALLRAEISGEDPEMLAEAEAAEPGLALDRIEIGGAFCRASPHSTLRPRSAPLSKHSICYCSMS